MKRSAKHVLIYFSLPNSTYREPAHRFRMRVGGEIEKLSADELGAATWIRFCGDEPRGLPSKADLLAQALTKIFGDLPPWEDRRLYPDGVVCVNSVITIELGTITVKS